MLDAVIISDIHLGAYNCQTKLLIDFLEKIKEQEILTQRLIINGDLFDSFNVRLRKEEWKILGLIRALSNDLNVVWIKGNHDFYTESSTVSHMLGTEYHPIHYIFETGDKKMLAMHGDIFDNFLSEHPILTFCADWIYWLLQKVDKSYTFAKHAKHNSKKYLHCSEIIEQEAKTYAKKFKCDLVGCGHTHFPIEKENYVNSGSWTEIPCSYVTVSQGKASLHFFKK